MKMRNTIFAFTFLSLLAFVFVFAHFFENSKDNKKVLTASLVQDSAQVVNNSVSGEKKSLPALPVSPKVTTSDSKQDQKDDELEKADLLNQATSNVVSPMPVPVAPVMVFPSQPQLVVPQKIETLPASSNVAIQPETTNTTSPITTPPTPPLPPPPPPPPVVLLFNIKISQVQTEGITIKDEFVKLYNPNDVDVDLTGFSLKKKTSSGTESNLVSAGAFAGTIKARGYFLIVPPDNDDGSKNYTGTLAPDLYYSGKTYSMTSDNTILLYGGDGTLVDEYLPPVVPVPVPDPIPDPSPILPPPDILPTPTVVINEITWMGTLVSSNNEWMELYNPGSDTVDLSGWTLSAADGTPTIHLFGTISSQGFYLLERTNDNSVPDISADLIYTGALGNSGENLSLFDASQRMVDQVNSTPWFFGDNETKQTMQRKDTHASGSDSFNWQTSQAVGGTPKS